jgi:hypothetical protein
MSNIKITKQQLEESRREYAFVREGIGGGFTTALYEAIARSKGENTWKLSQVYPVEVYTYFEYTGMLDRCSSIQVEGEDGIPLISTGQPSTLKTYRGIAFVMGGFDDNSKPVKFIDDKIAEQGPDAEVLADERQMLALFAALIREEIEEDEANV